MMRRVQRRAILGFCAGIGRSSGFAVWAQSALATGNDVHVLCVETPLDIPGLRVWRIKPPQMPEHPNAIHHHALVRWGPIARWLRWAARKYDAVCLSDVRDSVFQRDPFPEVAPDRKRWILGAPEPWPASGHEWCKDQSKKMRAVLAEPWPDGTEYCGGLLFGDPRSLAETAIWMSAAGRFLASAGLSDQAPLNLYLRSRARPVPPGIYLHGEGVARSKTKPQWEEYAIYHQYDRVTGHAQAIRQRWPIPAAAVQTQVIIARYSEDVSRLVERFADYAPLVYDKGDGSSGGLRRENIGFEAETWLQHFATRYDELPPVTLCLQGNPSPHCSESEIEALLCRDPADCSFEPLGPGIEQRPDGSPDHRGLGENIGRLWRAFFGAPVPHRWFAWYGGQFAVHRDRVRRRPREWYARAAELVRTKEDACAVERMWQAIFSP